MFVCVKDAGKLILKGRFQTICIVSLKSNCFSHTYILLYRLLANYVEEIELGRTMGFFC